MPRSARESQGSTPPPGNAYIPPNAIAATRRITYTSKPSSGMAAGRSSSTVAASRGTAGVLPSATNRRA